MTQSKISIEERLELEAFLFEEARLLDERLFDDWLALFAPNARYWVPVRQNRWQEGKNERWDIADETMGVGDLGYFEDTNETLYLRVQRLRTGLAWSENPPSRTRHLFTNIVAQRSSELDSYEVRANFLLYQSRLAAKQNLFVGMRTDIIRRTDGALRFCDRKILLDSAVLPSSNLSVFF